MIEPTVDDIGRRVIYRDLPKGIIEEGVLLSAGHDFVYVRYKPTAAARYTPRLRLDWSHRQPDETGIRYMMDGNRIVGIEFCKGPSGVSQI